MLSEKERKHRKMSVLKIPKIPQYGVLVEEKYEKKDSLFHDVYQGAVKNVYDIINKHYEKPTEITFNPCIAFVGKRGTGKSSAMSSFANFLHKSKTSNLNWIGDKKIQELIQDSSFYMLPAIDTTNMSEKETIIADVSAEMYSEYKKLENGIPIEQKRRFIEATKKANDTAILKSSGDWTNQGDQLLVETDKIVHIKELFKEMVDIFLEIGLKTSNENNRYLVIQIDDLDMNITNSFSILEEIRSILSVKNVIVLISVDIEQLKTVLKFHFERSLETKKDTEKEKISKDLAYKYIEKLLPIDRRNYMPELTLEQLKSIRAENFLNEDDTSWSKWKIELDGNDKPSVFHAIMHLIWRKTLLIPTKNKFNDYVLIPHNLRSLCNFVVFLRNMKDVAYPANFSENNETTPLTYFDFAQKENGETYRNLLDHNLNSFKKYLISNIEVHTKPEMTAAEYEISHILQNIIFTIDYTNTEEINNKIIGDIIYLLTEKENKDYFKLLNKNGTIDSMRCAIHQSCSLGIGDVIYVLKEIEKNSHCRYIHYLVEIIRTLWNIRMTKELFIIGCNPQNKDSLEPDSKYITESFRKVIGTIIVNPDVDKISSNYIEQELSGWQVIKNRKIPSIFDVVIPNNKGLINNEIEEKYFTCDINGWRTNLRTGAPLYKGYLESDELLWLSHPMLIFSNLLVPCLRANKNPKLREDYYEWQQKYIMALPFYSINFIQRFLSFLELENNRDVYPSQGSLLTYILNKSHIAIKNLWQEINYYIPTIGVSDIAHITQEYPNESQNNNLYFFEAPLLSLKDKMDDDLSLVSINIYWLENIDKTLSNMAEIVKTDYNNDDSMFLRDLYKIIEAQFSIEIVKEFFPKGTDELTESKIRNFLDDLNPQKYPQKPNETPKFIPYYFCEKPKNDEEPKDDKKK